MKTIGERFALALDRVYGTSSTKKCVEDLGVSQSTVDRGKKGDSLTKTIAMFAAKNGVSSSWLLTGAGDMFDQQSTHSNVNYDDLHVSTGIKTVADASANTFGSSQLTAQEETLLENFRILDRKMQRKALVYVMQMVDMQS